MGSIEDLFDRFYSPTSKNLNIHEPFSFYYAPALYLEKIALLKPIYLDPKELEPPRFEMAKLDEKAFRHQHPPNRSLDLQSDEEYLCFKAKKRPFISICPFYKIPVSNMVSKLFRRPATLLLPVYSLKDSEGRLKPHFTQTFYRNVASLRYNQLFFLPASTGAPIKNESFIRFDRAFCFPRNYLEPTFAKLVEDVAEFLFEFFKAFLKQGEFEESWVAELVKTIQESTTQDKV